MRLRRLQVSAQLAWRILVHEKGRTGLALAGVFIAIVLVFIELGFFVAVPQGGMLVYDSMRFDLLLVSRDYAFQAQPWQFARERMSQAGAVSGVARVTPLYFAGGQWQDVNGGTRLDVFLLGCDPKANPFAVDGIEGQQAVLAKADTMLVDDFTRSVFGPLTTSRAININGHRMTIGGRYHLGTGFLGIGVALMDEANFQRVTGRRTDPVNLGLIQLAPGAKIDSVQAALRSLLPDDVRVWSRKELKDREDSYWTTRTSVGLIFGSGLVVSFIVGLMVLYQTLATQITRHLPEFATLKAMGYADAQLASVVIFEAAMIVIVAFLPATGVAMAAYALIRSQTLLPVVLTPGHLVLVLGVTLIMSGISAFLSVSGLRRADPADVF